MALRYVVTLQVCIHFYTEFNPNRAMNVGSTSRNCKNSFTSLCKIQLVLHQFSISMQCIFLDITNTEFLSNSEEKLVVVVVVVWDGGRKKRVFPLWILMPHRSLGVR
jgi:hypothetical protein